MKGEAVTLFEERLVFNVSRHLWLAFVLLAMMAIIAGSLALVWGLVPAFKSQVNKEPYPAPVTVTAEDVIARLKPQPEEAAQSKPEAGSEAPAMAAPTADAGREAYQKAFANLKRLLPAPRFQWGITTRWEYPYGEAYWEETQDVDARRAVEEKGWSLAALEAAFDRVSAYDYANKRSLVEAYASLIGEIPPAGRADTFDAVLKVSKSNVADSVSLIHAMKAVALTVDQGRSKVVTTLSTFIDDNPGDGLAFTEYAGSIIEKFASGARVAALGNLIDGYESTFYRNLGTFKEATDAYLPLLASLEPATHAKALPAFYDIYLTRNGERSRAISEIDSRYESELAAAEQAYQAEIERKGLAKKYSLYAIGAGLVVTAFIGLFLVLLSAQRYLKRISEALTTQSTLVPALKGDGDSPNLAPQPATSN